MNTDVVIASVFIEASPEQVWEYFTTPQALTRWMGERAVLEPERGGEFTVDVKGAPVRGRFLRLDRPHRLLLSWGYAGSQRLPPGASTVEVRLTPEGGGTRVDLEHRGLPSAEQAGHDVGWTHYLARLAVAVIGDAGPDPGMREVAPSDYPV